MSRILVAAVVGSALSGPVSLNGATIAVPGDFPTISEALGGAAPGDTIALEPGVYPENLVITQAVHIFSKTAGAGEIVGQVFEKPVIRIEGVRELCTLRGLKINGNRRSAAGVEVVNSRLELVGTEILRTSVGVFFRQSEGRIADNIFRGNGGGDVRLFGSSPLVAGNRFESGCSTAIQIMGKKSQPVIGGSRGNGNAFGPGYETLVVNESKNEINARHNRWNWSATVSMNAEDYPANIRAIYDGFDDGGYGKVDYRNWVDGESGGKIRRVAIPVVIAVLIVLVIVVRLRAGARA
ncbi:MAG: right-handed parallel beta-helix repeat-containing protein [Candidatus Eisenbacteria sp.]|nr:right-handed parallel beta-helix repeat-containing protein [Candidatus Eisenbacteria bacterium]